MQEDQEGNPSAPSLSTFSFYDTMAISQTGRLYALYLLMKLDHIQWQSITPALEDKTSFMPSTASALV